MKKNVLILFGGVSSEHEISRLSTASVLKNIDRDKYEVVTIGITKTGAWFLTEASADEISDGSWEHRPENRSAIISPDRRIHGIVIDEQNGEFSKKYIDVVFPVMHGQNAEDGTIQGLMQIAGIPCVGPGTESSSACMDKAVTKAMVDQNGFVAQASGYVSHRNIYEDDKEAEKTAIVEFFEHQFPLFVKPANAGSSVGISKVKTEDDLEKALELAFEVDKKALVEEAIVGREIEVAVLGNENPKASCLGEIFSANEFYDFNAKYENESSKTSIVADLPEEIEKEIQEAALTVYNVMGCKGMARVDFFLQEDGKVVFNEINTIPGFTKISMYPQLWMHSGISYSALIDQLLELAIENKACM